MDKRLAAERTRMYAAMREINPLYFGDPLKYTGDPAFSGPAYGEYNKSGGGFIGAVVQVGLAFATGGFSTIASSIATIGSIVSAVGQITGNQSLSKLGTVASLVGGVGVAANNGLFGEGVKNWANQMDNSIMQSIGGTPAFKVTTAQNISNAATTAGTDIAATDGASAVVDTGELNLKDSVGPATGSEVTPGIPVENNSIDGMINKPQGDAVFNDVTGQYETIGGGVESSSTVEAGGISNNPGLEAFTGDGKAPVADAVIKPVTGPKVYGVQDYWDALKSGVKGTTDTATKYKDLAQFLPPVLSLFKKPDPRLNQQQLEEESAARTAANNANAAYTNARTAETNQQMANANFVPTYGGLINNYNAQVSNRARGTSQPGAVGTYISRA